MICFDFCGGREGSSPVKAKTDTGLVADRHGARPEWARTKVLCVCPDARFYFVICANSSGNPCRNCLDSLSCSDHAEAWATTKTLFWIEKCLKPPYCYTQTPAGKTRA